MTSRLRPGDRVTWNDTYKGRVQHVQGAVATIAERNPLLGRTVFWEMRVDALSPARAKPGERDGARVPVEYIGLARALIGRITAADAAYESAAARLLTPFRPRQGFLAMPRRQHLERLALRWKTLPPALRRVIKNDPGRLQIAEMRAAPFALSMEGWTDGEIAIAISLRAVTLAPPLFADARRLLTALGLHALARRYERSTDRSDEAIFRPSTWLRLAKHLTISRASSRRPIWA